MEGDLDIRYKENILAVSDFLWISCPGRIFVYGTLLNGVILFQGFLQEMAKPFEIFLFFLHNLCL